VRASVVSSAALAEVAALLDLGAALLLGKGEDQSGGREKPSILADAMEAVIGAVYLDGGWDGADEFVMRLLGERIAEAAAGPGGQDFKTRLQELAARSFDELPRYEVADEGPDHAKRFFATVSVAGEVRGRGEGRSKKQAEQAAARLAWQELATAPAPAAAPQTPEAVPEPGA
jgi:ribonuclease III